MLREKLNLEIYKGETFSIVIALKDAVNDPIDLTGASISAICKDKSSNNTICTFTTNITSPSSDGEFTLSLSANTSESLVASNNYIYDVKITFSSGEVVKWISGSVSIKEMVTQ
jgi:hypothetical protein